MVSDPTLHTRSEPTRGAPVTLGASVGSPLADPYRLISIVAVAAPSGAAGSRWHRYEIAQGRNTIVGYREGVLDNVTVAVEDIVDQLNARRLFRNGRSHTASSRSKAHTSEP